MTPAPGDEGGPEPLEQIPPAPAREIVVLAGGTGGAKLARGVAQAYGPERLTVIANTGDDIEIYGAHVSPDPDLVSFWLADSIDERGWGLRDDTFAVMDALRALGVEVWFNLGDRDLAWCIERARLIAEGLTPTAALARLNEAGRLRESVLPMTDAPVRTWVQTDAAGWRSFQEYMIRGRASGRVEGVEYHGAEDAAPSAEVLEAIAAATVILIGPSNPIASIGPILAVPGLRAALRDAAAPVVGVSPIVAGEVIKGPTAAFMEHAGQPLTAAGVAAVYGADLLDGMVADEQLDGIASVQTETLMADALSRAALARAAVEFAESLTG
ncbi:MAG TPA: 2-phospho-L-lactate transferase [Solirubrobacteraceae bacterium]|nr:2-phospho-L-lactate transferase [Solirubrobacteraceae bacterium]